MVRRQQATAGGEANKEVRTPFPEAVTQFFVMARDVGKHRVDNKHEFSFTIVPARCMTVVVVEKVRAMIVGFELSKEDSQSATEETRPLLFLAMKREDGDHRQNVAVLSS